MLLILFGILGSYLFSQLGIFFIKIGKISAKIHEIGKIKAIFGLGMIPKNGKIRSLNALVQRDLKLMIQVGSLSVFFSHMITAIYTAF